MTSSLILVRPLSARTIRHSTLARPPRIALLASVALAACAAAPSATEPLQSASTATAPGRWDDLTAALVTAQREHEMSVLTDRQPAPGVRELTFLTVLDQRVVVRVTAADHADPEAETPIELEVVHGLWGDPEHEAAIIQTLRRRLEKLAQKAR